jgi:2-hydroxychromene-2-carboxylate isomerase
VLREGRRSQGGRYPGLRLFVTAPIEFYFDFASPYGFIAAMQIESLARPVAWRPFLLGAVYKTFGQSPLDHPLKKDYVLEVDAPRMARRIGLRLELPAGFPEHALAPSRAFYWIEERDPATAVAFAKLAYRKYWLEGRATSDAAAAADAAAEAGVDRAAVLAGMQDARIKGRLLEANRAAVAKGVFGSPFFLVDGQPFWGSDRLPLVAAK